MVALSFKRVKPFSLGVGYPAGTRDNWSVAEIGKRRHLKAARYSEIFRWAVWLGVAASEYPTPLTRRIEACREVGVLIAIP